MMTRQVVYVCSPFRAPTAALVARNIYRAAWWAERLRERDYAPLVPHTMTAGMCPVSELAWDDERWLEEVCLPLLDGVDAIFLAPGWMQSAGCQAEEAYVRESFAFLAARSITPSDLLGSDWVRRDLERAVSEMPSIYLELARALMGGKTGSGTANRIVP